MYQTLEVDPRSRDGTRIYSFSLMSPLCHIFYLLASNMLQGEIPVCEPFFLDIALARLVEVGVKIATVVKVDSHGRR